MPFKALYGDGCKYKMLVVIETGHNDEDFWSAHSQSTLPGMLSGQSVLCAKPYINVVQASLSQAGVAVL